MVSTPPTTATANPFDRVRNHTATQVNAQIDAYLQERVHHFAHQSELEINQRLQVLDREWDTERVLETNASLLALIGLGLGLTVSPYWFWLPGLVLPFLFQHAVQGWCPPLPIIRRLGVRTRSEIDQEKYALKWLRGDFERISRPAEGDGTQVETLLTAVKA